MNISPCSLVEPSVRFGSNCIVHPFAWIGKQPSKSLTLARNTMAIVNTQIGDGVEIGPHCVIYANVTIGDRCFIGDGANIREGTRIGRNCVIGQGVSINYDVEIGDNVRIMNGTHITGGMRIGSGTFIGAGVITANDNRLEVVKYKFVSTAIKPPIIGENCLIGSGAMILPNVTIGHGAVIGMGAVVTKAVKPYQTVVGLAARDRDVIPA